MPSAWLVAKSQADPTREIQEAEARGAKLLEQSRHQATEVTNAARAEVEQTLEWARTQARTVMERAQHGAGQLLGAAGLGQEKIAEVAAAIIRAAEGSGEPRPAPPVAALTGSDEPEARSRPNRNRNLSTMRPLFGPRTVVEAAFLVAVPIVALEAGVSWYAIVAAGAAAYFLVLIVEAVLWRQAKRALPPPPPEPLEEEVVARPPEHVRVIRTAPEIVAEPEPMPAPPALASVPEPEPEPVPAPEPEPELPPAAEVIPIAAATGPRQWNVWDLEQLARENAGGDPVVDEERTFLLMYLRDFAGPDGLLPADFDDLVRQSFGGLVANR